MQKTLTNKVLRDIFKNTYHFKIFNKKGAVKRKFILYGRPVAEATIREYESQGVEFEVIIKERTKPIHKRNYTHANVA